MATPDIRETSPRDYYDILGLGDWLRLDPDQQSFLVGKSFSAPATTGTHKIGGRYFDDTRIYVSDRSDDGRPSHDVTWAIQTGHKFELPGGMYPWLYYRTYQPERGRYSPMDKPYASLVMEMNLPYDSERFCASILWHTVGEEAGKGRVVLNRHTIGFDPKGVRDLFEKLGLPAPLKQDEHYYFLRTVDEDTYELVCQDASTRVPRYEPMRFSINNLRQLLNMVHFPINLSLGIVEANLTVNGKDGQIYRINVPSRTPDMVQGSILKGEPMVPFSVHNLTKDRVVFSA